MKYAVSLFSNIGVSESYFDEINVKTVVANEIDEERCDIYKKIYPNVTMVRGNIADENIAKEIINSCKNEIDFLIATPPCQGFSTLNSKKKDDPRNFLIKYVLDIAQKINPKNILIENVPRMLNQIINGMDVINFIQNKMSGYKVQHHILDAADYGTPQTRKRVFILLSKSNWNLPQKKEKISLLKAIGHLPSLESGQRLTQQDVDVFFPHYDDNKKDFIKTWHYAQKHSEKHIEWMSNTAEGKSAFENEGKNNHFPQVEKNGKILKIKGYKNTYKRMSWNKPANTLIAGSSMVSSSNTVHPGRLKKDGTYSDARTFSILEAMLIMGIPIGWNLPKNINYRKAMHYIGEGLCPILLKELLLSCNNQEKI